MPLPLTFRPFAGLAAAVLLAACPLSAAAQDGTALVGESKQADGSTVLNRISFRNNPDHTVRQLWETSSDGGATWAPVLDGLYKKRRS